MGVEKIQYQDKNKDILKQQELFDALQGFQQEQQQLEDTIKDADLATEENVEKESLNYKFLQNNPDISDIIEKNGFKIDLKNKTLEASIRIIKGGKPYDYIIQVTKKGLTINGEINTEFLDGLSDQDYSNKNSKVLFDQLRNWFNTSGVVGNEDNKATLMPKIEKLADAHKVFDALFQ